MLSKIYIFMLIFASTLSFAAEQTTKITDANISNFRTHSASHPVVAARKTHMLFVTGLSGGCTRLFFALEDNKEMYSLLLAAYISKVDMTVRYLPEITSPWNDTAACQLISVTLGE